MNKTRIRQLFLEVADKAKAAIDAGEVDKPKPGIVMSSLLIRSGLIFRADVADAFFRNVDEAAELAKADLAWGKSAIDRAFSDGLIAISNGSSIAAAAQILQASLDKKPRKYEFRFAIFGLTADCKPTDFGLLKIDSASVTPDVDFGPFLKSGVATTYQFAQIESEGIDSDSARLRAEQVVDRHLALLNIFCGDDIPARSYLSRSYVGAHDFTIVQENKGQHWSDGASSSLVRRSLSAHEWNSVLSSEFIGSASNLLKKTTPFADHLLEALALAGDALRESSIQNSFLLLAVAVESALMGGKSETEITVQFALRAALLSAGSGEQRVRLHGKIKRLYRLRSAIVHKGSKSVTSSDLAEMRNVSIGCLIVLCCSADFSTMETIEDLDAWFLERMLTAPNVALGENIGA